ncbi:MAG: ADOP family duplicated permease [Gemmatimonadetes bacterium]|nr:ADOP family duplicated permease [Gemmatimonadota bacterium]
MLRDLLADLRSALRSLRREPGFVLLAVLTLAVGVGCTATVFGMVNQLVLSPLPGVRDPDRAAYLEMNEPPGARFQTPTLNTPDFDELRQAATLLSGLASSGPSGMPQVSSGGGPAVRVHTADVYGDVFRILGVRPAEGRLLRGDESLGDPRIAVISQELRAKLFGDAKSAVGRTIEVDGQTVTVVGVAGGGFQGVDRRIPIQMWLPFSSLTVFNGFKPEDLTSRDPRLFGGTAWQEQLVARLKPGVSVEAAEAQIRTLLRDLAAAHPDDAYLLKANPVLVPGLPLSPQVVSYISRSLTLFAGVVMLVLLIACANVATLLLMRNVTRRSAIATRRALGASPGRIARRHLTESAFLAVLGTGAGLGAAWFLATLLHGQRITRGLPALNGFTIDVRMLAFAVAASVATLVIFGAVPAMLAGRFDLAATLQEAGSRETHRMAGLRRLLSTAQIAVSIMLLTGAALLVRTVHNLYAIDTGLSLDGVSTLSLGSPGALGPPSQLSGIYRSVLAAVGPAPGVETVGLGMGGPLSRPAETSVAMPDSPQRTTFRNVRPVTAGWFRALGVHMVDGRPFSDEEWEPGAGAIPIVVTASMARHLFGRTEVVGRKLLVNVGDMQDATVVGVSQDMRLPDAPDRPLDAIFLPMASFPVKSVTLIVRTLSLDAGTRKGIQQAVDRVLPNPVPPGLVPVKSEYARIFAEQRSFGRLLELLSVLAVILASIGLYSVIGFSVAQRRREFGIRIALGAEASRIARHALGDAATIIALGTGVGLVGAYMLSILLANQLYGVAQVDPLSYGGAALLFAVVAAVACWMPARAAMRADPVETLREE